MNTSSNFTFHFTKKYASFLLHHSLDALVRENIQLAEKFQLPMLEMFRHLSQEEIEKMAKDSLRSFLTNILEDKALEELTRSINQWKRNEIPGIAKEKVQGSDIVLSYSIRKQLFLTFLPEFTEDCTQIVQIMQELEQFYIYVQKYAFDTYIDIQQESLKLINEELKAQQEELITLNEELRENQEELKVVNEELQQQVIQRQETEQALRKSENRFRLLTENTSDLISTHDFNGDFTYVSPSYEVVLGYAANELMGHSPFEFVHPEDLPILRKSHASLLTEGRTQPVIYRKRTKSGAFKWFESVSHVIRHPQTNQIMEIQVDSRDISLRKEAEEKLDKEQAYLKAVLEYVADGIVACNEEGIISFFNKATREFHGLSEKKMDPEQLAAYYNLYYNDGKTLLQTKDIPLLKVLRGEKVENMEMVIAPANGKRRLVVVNGNKIFSSEGKPLGAVVVMHDITQRKEAENKIVRNEAMLTESQEIAHVGSWEWDIEADYVTWSDEMKRIFGYPADTKGLNYETYLQHLHPEDREFAHSIISQTFQTHQPFAFQHRIITQRGEIRFLQARGKAMVSPEGKLLKMIGAGLDITELKEVEKEMNEKNQELAQALEELKNAEEYLVKINNELELRVQERTSELQASQEELLQTLDQTLELNVKLSESENFLSSIIAQSPVSTFITDAEGTQIRVNKACLELFGVEDESLGIGKYNILKDDLLQNLPFFKDIEAVFKEGKLARFSSPYNLSKVKHVNIPTGKPIFLVVTIFPIKNASGKVTHAVVQHEDITLRKMAEDSLLASEERYKAFVQQSSEAIWRFEFDGIPYLDIDLPMDEQIDLCYRHLYLAECNDTMARMYGFHSAEEIIGARLGDMLPRNETANLEYLCTFMQAGYHLSGAQSVEMDKDGNTKYFINNLIGIVEGNKLLRAWGIQRDITESKKAEDALKASEARFRSFIESIPQMVWTNLPDGRVDYYSQHWYDYSGLTFEQIKDNGWEKMIHPEDLPLTFEIFTHALTVGESFEVRHRMKRGRDEVYRWHLVRGVPLRNEVGNITLWIGTATDIHDQKVAEEELAETQREFRFLAEFIPQLVWRADANGNYDYFNQRWYDYTGLNFEESKLNRWTHVLHSDDSARALEIWQFSLQTGNPYEIEYRLRKFDGTYRWFLGRAIPLKDDRGKVLRWFGTCTDIDEQKQMEEVQKGLLQQVQIQRQKLYDFLMQAPASICVLSSPSFTFDLVNPQFQKLLGNRTFLNQPFAEALPDIAEQGYIQVLNEVYETGKPFFGNEIYAGIDRNGTGEWDYGYFNFVYQPIIYSDKKVESIFIFAYEVTEQVNARRTIEEYATKVRQILDSIPQIAWTANAKGINTYSNRRWYEYTGAEIDSSTKEGTTLIQYLHPDDVAPTIESWKYALQQSQPLEIECRIRRKDGVYRWMLNRALPVKNARHEITEWVGTCTDIHDQKTAIEELAQTKMELETKNEELTRVNVDLDNFVYTASHDLRSPITNLDGLQQMLRERLEGKLDTTSQKLIEHMTTSVTKLNRTINDLSEIVKVQKEKDQAFEEVYFQEVLEDVQSDIQPLIAQSQARIDVNFEIKTINYARKHLRSILYNLLSNAIKYRSPQNPLHVDVNTRYEENKVCLSVSDNGLGIDESQIDKIFMMFKRAHTHVEGSGIGLYMVKRIIENYGGQIKVTSNKGVGTTFSVYFKK